MSDAERAEQFVIKDNITIEGITPDFVSYNAKLLVRDMDSWKYKFERIVKVMEDRHEEHLKMINDLLAENYALKRKLTKDE
jgi:hypothetical protein